HRWTSDRYPLYLHDALPISKITPDMTCEEIGIRMQEAMEGLVLYGVMGQTVWDGSQEPQREMLLVRIEEGGLVPVEAGEKAGEKDRKSTRLNSSHDSNSYAV